MKIVTYFLLIIAHSTLFSAGGRLRAAGTNRAELKIREYLHRAEFQMRSASAKAQLNVTDANEEITTFLNHSQRVSTPIARAPLAKLRTNLTPDQRLLAANQLRMTRDVARVGARIMRYASAFRNGLVSSGYRQRIRFLENMASLYDLEIERLSLTPEDEAIESERQSKIRVVEYLAKHGGTPLGLRNPIGDPIKPFDPAQDTTRREQEIDISNGEVLTIVPVTIRAAHSRSDGSIAEANVLVNLVPVIREGKDAAGKYTSRNGVPVIYLNSNPKTKVFIDGKMTPFGETQYAHEHYHARQDIQDGKIDGYQMRTNKSGQQTREPLQTHEAEAYTAAMNYAVRRRKDGHGEFHGLADDSRHFAEQLWKLDTLLRKEKILAARRLAAEATALKDTMHLAIQEHVALMDDAATKSRRKKAIEADR